MFEFKTKLGKKELWELNKFNLYGKNKYIILLFSVLFLILGLLMFLTAEDSGEKVFSIIFMVVFGLGFAILEYPIMKFIVWLMARSSSVVSDDNKVYYKFDSEFIISNSDKSDLKTTIEAKWSHVYKAYESKTHYFIYISNMQAYIIPKNSIITDECEDFSKLLKEKLDKKFIVRK